MLKFYSFRGRFPRGRSELPDAAVEFVARQVKVPPSDVGFYEWPGGPLSITGRRSAGI